MQRQHAGGGAVLQMEQRLVLEQVMPQIARAPPMPAQPADPGDALFLPSLYLQHMRHPVCRLEIAGVTLDGGTAGSLGLGVAAAFLHCAAAAAKQAAPAGQILAPGAFNL
jgi:hypothetical protein